MHMMTKKGGSLKKNEGRERETLLKMSYEHKGYVVDQLGDVAAQIRM
jgi:hypothetical protein